MHPTRPYLASAVKRLADVILCATAIVLLLPLFVVLALLVKVTSRGPVFFLQERSGKDGKLFRVIKFRTMAASTKVEIGKETRSDDPRITSIGKFLRLSGLDEIPQFFNVLFGQMSIVGPRPLLKWENDQCNPRQVRRLDAKPGITGLSQIRGRNNAAWARRVEWDIDYIEGAHFLLDFKIMLMTVPVVVFGKNAYLDTGVPSNAPALVQEPEAVLETA